MLGFGEAARLYRSEFMFGLGEAARYMAALGEACPLYIAVGLGEDGR